MLLAEEILSNRETLNQITCADFPTRKEESRSKTHKEIFKKAYPNNKPRIVSFDQLEGLLNG